MHTISQQFQPQMVHLSQLTYRSTDTQEIKTATIEFKNQMVFNYPKSFSKLQEMITKKEQYDILTRQALINLYKISAQHLQYILQGRSLTNQEILASHKQLLHLVEHAFDNQKIQSAMKRPISVAYVNLFCLFNPQNYQRIITKSKYFFNTKEEMQAFDLLEIYYEKKIPFKFKQPFYGPCLHTLLSFLLWKLNILYNSPNYYQYQFARNLRRLVELFETAWCNLTFQTFESEFVNELNNNGLFCQVLDRMLGKAFPENIQVSVFRIVNHLTSALTRTRMIKQYEGLAHVFIQLAQGQFNKLIQNNTPDNDQSLKIEKINYLITCCDCSLNPPLVEFTPSFMQLYAQLIYPNFKAIQKYLNLHSKNISQICNFLQDISFDMESQCIEVVTNKLIVTLYRSSQTVRMNMRMMIGSFLFEYLPSVSHGQILPTKSGVLTQMGLPFWSQIGQKIDQKQQILSVLLMVALLVKQLMKDFQFISSLQSLLSENSQFFLMKDREVAFYSLIIYKNFNDDIFSSIKSGPLKLSFTQIALKEGQNSIIRQFSLSILRDQFSNNPPYNTIDKMIQYIFESMLLNFDQSILEVIESIFQNYPSEISKLRSTLPLVKNIIQHFESNIANNKPFHQLICYFQLVKLIFSINGIQAFFPQIINHIVERSLVIPNKNIVDGEEILSVIVKGLKVIGELPPSTQLLLMQFKWEYVGIQIVNNFTDLIQYTKNTQFLNWLFLTLTQHKFTIQTCLLLHSIIYHQIKRLNPNHFKHLIEKIYRFRMINRLAKNYINGKLNIIILLIMKLNRGLLYSYLQSTDWSALQEQVYQETKSFSLGKDQSGNQVRLSFLEEIYQLVYLIEHSYSWKYDIEMFLVLQIDILNNQLQEQHQFKYANISFVACTKNILRVYEAICHNLCGQDKDDEESYLFPEKQFDMEEERHRKITQQYHRPEGLNKDYFAMYHVLIQKLKKNEGSKEWMKTIINTVFDPQDYHLIEEIINSSILNHNKIRKIFKVK